MSHFNKASTTRRAVVAGLAAAAGSTAIAAPARALAAPASKPASEFDQWRGLADRNFRVAAEASSCGLFLVAVRAMPAKGARPSICSRPHAFAAIFEAPAGTLAPAGDRTYAVQHSELGTFPLFLSAPGREGDKLRFAVIFN